MLARDPYGIKPLYYADDGWTFRFASQVKALRAGGAVGAELEPAGQVGFCLLGSVPEPFTAYREIRALPAGTTLRVDRLGGAEPRRYHSVAQVYREAEESAPGRRAIASAQAMQRAMEEVRAALLDSVRHHLVADVPVGAFLSAGIDSSALVGLMRDAGRQDIETVTLAFGEFRGRPEDEAPLAEEVARLYGTRHTTRIVTQAEFEADLPRILEAMDQPSIDGINTWFVAKAARELGLKVAVSGLGGDELFGGYPSFRDIPRWVALLAAPARVPLLGRIARMAARPLAGALGRHPKLAGIMELGGSWAGAYLLRRGLFMPWELGQVLAPDVAAEGLRRLAPLRLIADALRPRPRSAHGKVAALETSLYMRNQLLRDTDWAGMAHGLEVRTPLADAVLLRKVAAAGAAAGWWRRDIPKAGLALSPGRPLPDRVLRRAKTGFRDADRPVAAGPGPDRNRRDRRDHCVAAQISADRALVAAVGGATGRRVMRLLALVTDGFGRSGGIARYNQDLLTALSQSGAVAQVSVLPRFASAAPALPAKVSQLAPSSGRTRLERQGAGPGGAAALRCGVLRPSPCAAAGRRGRPPARLPLWVQAHGIEAWQPPGALCRRGLAAAALVTSVSRYTRARVLAWADVAPDRLRVLPNTVDARYPPQPTAQKPHDLARHHGLDGRRIVLTVARLSAAERYKGHDRLIAALPAVLAAVPDATYLIVGVGRRPARGSSGWRGARASATAWCSPATSATPSCRDTSHSPTPSRCPAPARASASPSWRRQLRACR